MEFLRYGSVLLILSKLSGASGSAPTYRDRAVSGDVPIHYNKSILVIVFGSGIFILLAGTLDARFAFCSFDDIIS